MPIDARTRYLGLDFDRLTLPQALAWVHDHAARSAASAVITPNVDHLVRLDKDESGAFRAAYACADLLLCDSRVLARIARWQGERLTVVPGSDLTAALLASLPPAARIAIVGGDDATVSALTALLPGRTFLQHIPPPGLAANEGALAAAAAWIVDRAAAYVFLAVGSPQSEILAARIKQAEGARGVLLCVGASIDFVTGKQRRAPRFLQRLGFEWAWRLARSPRRLARRYLVEGPRIFAIAYRGTKTSR